MEISPPAQNRRRSAMLSQINATLHDVSQLSGREMLIGAGSNTAIPKASFEPAGTIEVDKG